MVSIKVDKSIKGRKILNFANVEKEIISDVIDLWKESIGKFLEEVASKVVVDTGMSLASLLPLAEDVDKQQIILAKLYGGGPTDTTKLYSARGPEVPAFFGEKDIGSGIHLGKKAYNLNFGTSTSPIFEFEFEIVVLQYFLHEEGLARPVSYVWNSLQTGKTAFLDHFNSKINKVLLQQSFVNRLLTGRLKI